VGSIPAVGAPSKDYAGWPDTPSHRPLLAVSDVIAPFANRWTEDKPHPELLRQVWPVFRRTVSAVDVCTKDGGDAGRRTLLSADVKPRSGWRSQSGEQLLQFETDPNLQANCEIQSGASVWLYRGADGRIRTLPGQNWSEDDATNSPPNLNLVDTGRLGGGDDEEAVFFLSGYDIDGYVLYYDHFQNFTRFSWSYH